MDWLTRYPAVKRPPGDDAQGNDFVSHAWIEGKGAEATLEMQRLIPLTARPFRSTDRFQRPRPGSKGSEVSMRALNWKAIGPGELNAILTVLDR
ncbi:MAG: hypothetical protein BGP09_24525 [Rhizobium sp. 60-20]|nr:MAG: hypothetical protein BGP09_24525 [Rhizobium sp. 60-20]